MYMKVYLIRNGEGFYKIGYTKHDVRYRMEQLQTGSSSELEFIAECLVKHPTKVESALHRKYNQFHVLGEWFDLPDEIVELFVDTASNTDDMFQSLIDSGNPFI